MCHHVTHLTPAYAHDPQRTFQPLRSPGRLSPNPAGGQVWSCILAKGPDLGTLRRKAALGRLHIFGRSECPAIALVARPELGHRCQDRQPQGAQLSGPSAAPLRKAVPSALGLWPEFWLQGQSRAFCCGDNGTVVTSFRGGLFFR